MEALRSAVLSSCFLGIISAVTEAVCPEGKAAGQIRLITGALLIIIIAAGVLKADFSEFKEAVVISENTSAEVSENADRYYREAMEKNLSRALSEKLSEKGIRTEKISARIDISENNSIYISEITAWLTDYSDYVPAMDILGKAAGEGVTIYVKRAEESENG